MSASLSKRSEAADSTPARAYVAALEGGATIPVALSAAADAWLAAHPGATPQQARTAVIGLMLCGDSQSPLRRKSNGMINAKVPA